MLIRGSWNLKSIHFLPLSHHILYIRSLIWPNLLKRVTRSRDDASAYASVSSCSVIVPSMSPLSPKCCVLVSGDDTTHYPDRADRWAWSLSGEDQSCDGKINIVSGPYKVWTTFLKIRLRLFVWCSYWLLAFPPASYSWFTKLQGWITG